MLSRRAFLSSAAAAACASARSFSLSSSDDLFLDELSRRAFRFFWEQADARTGLALDRTRNSGDKTPGRSREVASLASTGFALTALSIGYRREWHTPSEIQGRVRNTLRHLAYTQEHVRGWFYHFVDTHTGERQWKSELSTIDSALLLAGVLTAQQCFASDAEIVRLAQEIYERVDFPWMLDPETNLIRMGWQPETGFLRAQWRDYRENLILALLAIASPTRPVPDSTWYAFVRDPVVFREYRFIGAGPIFTHQFSHAWLDLEGLQDGPPLECNYFRNSVVATYAHRQYCLSLRGMFPSYSENVWGITPSDSDIGYLGWGDYTRRDFDGTVVPCASAGSLMFTPEISLPALRTMHERFGRYAFGRYGFFRRLSSAHGLGRRRSGGHRPGNHAPQRRESPHARGLELVWPAAGCTPRHAADLQPHRIAAFHVQGVGRRLPATVC
ncbi:MAG: glucoamylase family protein [Ignavibacteriota bacterium]